VHASIVVRVSGFPWNSERSISGPSTTLTRCFGHTFGLPSAGSAFWLPQFAIGYTGAPDLSAIRATPFFGRIGQPSGSAV
jgi:hypothetical protein